MPGTTCRTSAPTAAAGTTRSITTPSGCSATWRTSSTTSRTTCSLITATARSTWSARRRASAAATCTASRHHVSVGRASADARSRATTSCRAASGSISSGRSSIRAAACSARAARQRCARARISKLDFAKVGRARMMTLYSADNSPLMEIERARAQRQATLLIKGKVFGTMPMTARLSPAEARKGLKLLNFKLALVLAHLLAALTFRDPRFSARSLQGRCAYGRRTRGRLRLDLDRPALAHRDRGAHDLVSRQLDSGARRPGEPRESTLRLHTSIAICAYAFSLGARSPGASSMGHPGPLPLHRPGCSMQIGKYTHYVMLHRDRLHADVRTAAGLGERRGNPRVRLVRNPSSIRDEHGSVRRVAHECTSGARA